MQLSDGVQKQGTGVLSMYSNDERMQMFIHQKTQFGIALVTLALMAGCAKSPGEQCLDSFRGDLKDPESGKVISFQDGTLVYTATNSYGARIQGKALCEEKVGEKGKWIRNRTGEYLAALELAAEMIKKHNECLNRGGRLDTCDANSPMGTILQANRSSSPDAYVAATTKEAKKILGFE